VQNYNVFFGAIRARYPHMRLVANCHMGQDAPTDMWDWSVPCHAHLMELAVYWPLPPLSMSHV
jgi:hypothetical protein